MKKSLLKVCAKPGRAAEPGASQAKPGDGDGEPGPTVHTKPGDAALVPGAKKAKRSYVKSPAYYAPDNWAEREAWEEMQYVDEEATNKEGITLVRQPAQHCAGAQSHFLYILAVKHCRV